MRPAALLLVLAAAAAAGCRGPGNPRIAVPDGDPERGRVAVQNYGCGTCHAIPGIPRARARVGPPLRGVADRAYIAGVLPNSGPNMIRWLRDPPGVDPRTAMPDMGVTEADARDISAYLYTLRAEPLAVRMARGYLERAIGSRAPQRARTSRKRG